MAKDPGNIVIMNLSINSIILLVTVVFIGLSAGLFFAWQVSVIPGTILLKDRPYLEVMQSINKAILNPLFFTVFFGSVVLLSIASIYEFHSNKVVFGLMLSSAITYMVGTVLVTGLGNVPLNDQLEALKIAEMNSKEIAQFRKFYESNWNKLHLWRTVFAVLSFCMAVLAITIETIKN
jgi:uncharacterized membrane protein